MTLQKLSKIYFYIRPPNFDYFILFSIKNKLFIRKVFTFLNIVNFMFLHSYFDVPYFICGIKLKNMFLYFSRILEVITS